MKFVTFKIILLLATGICVQGHVFAQENSNMEERIIGSTFKSLAKTFVAMADMHKLKKDNTDKLHKMDEVKFQRQYAKMYEIIKELPPAVKKSYGVTEHMAKEQAIKNTESLDKKKAYELIDAIPDTVIARQFKKYLSERKQEIQKSGLVEQVTKFWNRMVDKINRPFEK